DADRPLAEQTVLAAAARKAGEDDHAPAGGQSRHAGAGRLDGAGDLAAVHVRQTFGWWETPVEQQHVDLVERARAHADQNVAGTDHRIAVVREQDLLGAAVLPEERRLQKGTSVRSSRTRRAL